MAPRIKRRSLIKVPVIFFQGSKDKVVELLAWCRTGPPAAKVDKVEVLWEEVGDELRGFDVRY